MPNLYKGPQEIATEAAKKLSDECISSVLRERLRHDLEPHGPSFRTYNHSARIKIDDELFCLLSISYNTEANNYGLLKYDIVTGEARNYSNPLHKISCKVAIILNFAISERYGTILYEVRSSRFIVPDVITNQSKFMEGIVADFISTFLSERDSAMASFARKAKENKKLLDFQKKLQKLSPAAAEGETLQEFEKRVSVPP